MVKLKDEIFNKIKHGDQEHQDWLENELTLFFEDFEKGRKLVKFSKTELGKLLSYFIHEHASNSALLQHYLSQIIKLKRGESSIIGEDKILGYLEKL